MKHFPLPSCICFCIKIPKSQIILFYISEQNNIFTKSYSGRLFFIGCTKPTDSLHPKGIQEKTLNTILEHLKQNKNSWLTGDEIAESVSLTSVTVRRYMNHLTQTGQVIADMNYETGGRPCMLYKIYNFTLLASSHLFRTSYHINCTK